MKNYFFGFAAIILAIAFSAFTKAPTASYTFKLKNGVDLTSESAIANKANWEESAISCSGGADIPCTITVDEQFTHVEDDGLFWRIALNIWGLTITIAVENGAWEVGVQYKRIASGANYVFQNQGFE
jgi:hypothetical protein